MALIEYDSYKQKLREIAPELDKLAAALDIESARQEAARLEDETAMDGFWNDLERSQKVQMRLKQLQNKITRQEKLEAALHRPAFPLFLGRRSCPPTLPLSLGVRELPLEEALRRYEEGMQALSLLEKELQSAQQKLTVLRRAADGTEEEIPLEVEE